MSARETLLKLDRVCKQYGSAHALRQVSLRAASGEFVVLLGPSGSGKSSLLRCVAGIERITSGAISLGDLTVDDGQRQVPPEQRDLAMVFQDYALWPHMTAFQNVGYALRRRHATRPETASRTQAMLQRVGLGELAQRYPSEMSGGEQQRVALARALVSSPRLLLFDEPLSNLDANLRDRMRVEIAVLAREAGATTLYITHDQAEAFALADQVGVLERGGQLVQFGTPEAIYSTPATPFVARLTGLAGELPGELLGVSDTGLAAIGVAGATLSGCPIGSVAPGPVQVLVRPAAVHLRHADDAGVVLRARVRDVAFAGRGYEHVVELAFGAPLNGVFAAQRWERGEQVGVCLDPAGCLVFPLASVALDNTVNAADVPRNLR